MRGNRVVPVLIRGPAAQTQSGNTQANQAKLSNVSYSTNTQSWPVLQLSPALFNENGSSGAHQSFRTTEWEGGQRHGQSERPDAGEMPKGNGLFRTDPINSPFEVKSVIRVISDAPKNGRETDTDTCGVLFRGRLHREMLTPPIRFVQVLQLPGCPVIPARLPACNSSPVDYLSGTPSVALSGHVVGENRALANGNTSDYITKHDTTLPPSYTSPLLPHAVELASGYPRESWADSSFEYLDNNFVGPMAGLGFIPSLRDRTSDQVISSDTPWPWISSPLLPSLPELYPSDNFTRGNTTLPPEQTQTGMAVPPHFFLSGITMQPTEQIHPRTPFPYAYPIPFQFNSTSYPTSDGYISSQPSFPMPNQNSSSWSLQEHLGYPLPVHPHYVTPVDLLGFHGIDTGSQMELHATLGTLDYNAAQVVHDHPSHTLSDYETHLRSHATNVLDDYTTGGKLDGYGNLVESKFNSEQVVGLGPQSPPPANQLPPSPRKLLSHDRVSRVKGRSLFRTFHRTCCPATARSRPKATRLSKTRSVCCHNVTVPCGWRDDEGKKCGMLISYGDCSGHFSTAHGITNIAWDVKVICCWCPSEPQRVVTRKNILRHMKEVHLCCARSENGI